MGASISYKYSRTARGLWMVILGIPLLIAYGLGLILIIIGAIRMKGSGKAKKVRKLGQEGYGKIAYKVKEQNITITSLTKKRVIFIYELENDLFGRTNESIDKKTYNAILKCGNIVPIIRYENRAVLNLDKLLNEENLVIDEKEVNFSSQEPAYKYRYGEMTKKSIVFLSLSAFFVILNVVRGIMTDISIQQNSGNNSFIGMTIGVTYVFYFALLLLALIFFFLGMAKMSFYGIAKKIRSDGKKGKKGKIIPIINPKNGNKTLVMKNKAIFQYTAENGLLIQTTQVISKKMFNKIMNDKIENIDIVELNNYAVIDNKSLLGKDPTEFDEVMDKVKKYHVMFFFALSVNIYFLISEIIHFVNSKGADGISLFTIIVYGLTIIYMSVMELLEFLNKKSFWAYLVTVLFLTLNIVATIVIVSMSFAVDGLNFVHTTMINWFYLGGLYFFYILFKLSKSITDAKKARRLDLDYNRCQGFGDIISNTYTLFNYFVWRIISFTGALIISSESAIFGMVGLDTILFMFIIIANVIASAIFIVKCGHGLSKENRLQKENVKD